MNYFCLIRCAKSFYSRSYIIILQKRKRRKESFDIRYYYSILVYLQPALSYGQYYIILMIKEIQFEYGMSSLLKKKGGCQPLAYL